MKRTRYLIVGGGLTADSACRGIRKFDPNGRILIVGEEPHLPYLRPPLSKALWKGGEESAIWRGTAKLGVDLRLGRRIVALDLDAHSTTDDRGESYGYEKLLLATGGRPRRLPFGGEDVVYFRTLDDYRRLRALADGGARFCVIGGGFIGSELAAALALNGCPVTMVFPGPGIGARIFPEELSSGLGEYYRGHDVEVLAGAVVTAVERHGETLRVKLRDGRTIEADAVVAGIGIEPNTDLAAAVGLPVANGIVVDAYGRAGRDDVFAAGDVARFPAAALATDLRVEHEDHAKSHGRRVGANMAGAGERYDHLPFFYSDLFDVGYEAVGELDARLDTLVDWTRVEGEGTITYLDQERRPRGLLLWNRFGHLDAARELIRAGEPVGVGVQVG
ncbi:MAG TPA: FAD-dependent oxidoreductase [Gaiellaceae bacterium]|nr:FAD-dependent oxidoreductase [Gaiellaceae bacterium]